MSNRLGNTQVNGDTKIGINVTDARQIPDTLLRMLLRKNVDWDHPEDIVSPNGRSSGERVFVFICNLDKAAMLVDLVRNYCRQNGYRTARAYVSVKIGWKSVPLDTSLSKRIEK